MQQYHSGVGAAAGTMYYIQWNKQGRMVDVARGEGVIEYDTKILCSYHMLLLLSSH